MTRKYVKKNAMPEKAANKKKMPYDPMESCRVRLIFVRRNAKLHPIEFPMDVADDLMLDGKISPVMTNGTGPKPFQKKNVILLKVYEKWLFLPML
jgi:hypothetical protein